MRIKLVGLNIIYFNADRLKILIGPVGGLNQKMEMYRKKEILGRYRELL